MRSVVVGLIYDAEHRATIGLRLGESCDDWVATRRVVRLLGCDAERRATLGTTLNIKWDGNNR